MRRNPSGTTNAATTWDKTMKEKLEEAVKASAEKAVKATDANDVLKFTQAALNAVHALVMLENRLSDWQITKNQV